MAPSDDDLRGAVNRALAADPGTAALEVRVGVLNAVVHLAGRVENEGLWHHVQAVAASVAGVRGVVNRIEAPGAPSPSRIIDIPLGERAEKTE